MCTLSIFVSCLCWAWVRNIGKALWKIVSQCSQALCSFWNTNLYIFPHNLAHNWHCTQPETGIIGYFHVSLHEAAIRVRTAGHWLSLFCSLEVQGGITLITFPRPIPGWAELCWACSDCATPLAHWNAHKHTEHPQGPQSLHLVIAAFQENHPKVWKQIFISSASNTPLRACVGVQPQTWRPEFCFGHDFCVSLGQVHFFLAWNFTEDNCVMKNWPPGLKMETRMG